MQPLATPDEVARAIVNSGQTLATWTGWSTLRRGHETHSVSEYLHARFARPDQRVASIT